MRRLLPTIFLLTAFALLAAGILLRTRPPEPSPAEEPFSLQEALGGDAEGYARAIAPRPFVFPADHGPHPEFKTEWWYFTGNLETEEGLHFGYQLTFFRVALAPRTPERSSAWATNQIYMAHFAITDAARQSFYPFERYSRAALNLAGAQAVPLRVWLEDWSVVTEGRGGEEVFPLRLHAAEGEVFIDLLLSGGKPVVLQGERGLSQKSGVPGNASYYYSLTRLPTEGRIRIGAEVFPVRGLSWFDREWSTSSLGRDEVGWDWFSLQLDDGRELMFYRLRQSSGKASPWSRGTLVAADGSVRPLTPDDVQIDELAWWQEGKASPRYPSRWRLRIPAAGLDLEIEPWVAGQEWQESVRYWEGAVKVQGTAEGNPVLGNGYVEMTGYGEKRE